MEKEYVEGFSNILRRLHADSNREKYHSIFEGPRNEDDARVIDLCRKFWPLSNSNENKDIDKYIVNDRHNEATAQKYLSELTKLLDKLGWEEI